MPIPAVVMAVGAGVAALAAWAFSQGPDRPGDHKKVPKTDDRKRLAPGSEQAEWFAGGTFGIPEVTEKYSTTGTPGAAAEDIAGQWVKKFGPPVKGAEARVIDKATEGGQQTWGAYAGGVGPIRVFYVWKGKVTPGHPLSDDDDDDKKKAAVEAFSTQVADALAKNDIPRLEVLAKQADKNGWHDIAVSIRAEIAILKGQAVSPADDDAKKKAAILAAKKKEEDDLRAKHKAAEDVLKAKQDEIKRLAARAAAEDDEKKKAALLALQKKAEDDARAALAAKKKAEDDARLLAAQKKKAEDDAKAAALLAAQQAKKKQATEPVESDSRVAAREVTDYLTSLGGLAARYKEDKPRMIAWLSRIGAPDPKGMYGRAAAAAVMQQGFVPVVPLHWPSGPAQGWASAAAKAKSEFRALVNQYKAADLPRAAQWDALLANVMRS